MKVPAFLAAALALEAVGHLGSHTQGVIFEIIFSLVSELSSPKLDD